MGFVRNAGAVLACAVGLSACSVQSPEDRINAAMPLGTELLAAKDAVDKLDPDSEAAAEFERAYQAKLKIRAIECGHGQEPSLFASAESIRAGADKACFA